MVYLNWSLLVEPLIRSRHMALYKCALIDWLKRPLTSKHGASGAIYRRNIASSVTETVWILSMTYDTTRNILDCDQSNVLLAHLFDSPWGVSYRWSMLTRRLPGTVIEILSLEDNGVTTFTFGVTWRHRSRDHSTPNVRFPIGGQWSPSVSLARLLRYSALKISGSRLWPFVVTWRYRSRDHSTPLGVFPMGGQWWPGAYLARLLRYSASKISRSRPW